MTDQNDDTLYVGIDVSDPLCRMFAVDAGSRLVLRRSIGRESIWSSLPSADRIVVGIEYRSGVHELACRLMRAGIEVRLIRFRDIPRVTGASSTGDYDCAEALCEAVRIGSLRHVPVLTPSQQGQAASQRVKALLKRQRAAILSAARNIVESVDAEQGSKVKNGQELARRLGSIAEASAHHRVATSLLDVMSVLERSISAFEDVEPRFEVISDQSFPSNGDDGAAAGPDERVGSGLDIDLRAPALPHPGSRAVPIDQGSSLQA